jgi:hypothetical protein
MATLAEQYAQLPPEVLALVTPFNVGAGVLNPAVAAEARSGLRRRVIVQGKLTKIQAAFMPVTLIPPAAYFYACADCAFHRQANKSCELVAGHIEPYAWCGLWLPQEDDRPLAWLTRAFA